MGQKPKRRCSKVRAELILNSFSSQRNSFKIQDEISATDAHPFNSERSHTLGNQHLKWKVHHFQTNVHTSSLVLVFGYLLFKFLFSCCNANVCSPQLPSISPSSPPPQAIPITLWGVPAFPSGADKTQAQFPISEPRLEATGNAGAFPPSCEPNTQSFQTCWSKNNTQNFSLPPFPTTSEP